MKEPVDKLRSQKDQVQREVAGEALAVKVTGEVQWWEPKAETNWKEGYEHPQSSYVTVLLLDSSLPSPTSTG